MFPPKFFHTVSSSPIFSHCLGPSSQPSHLNYCHSCFVVNHSPCFSTPDPSPAQPPEWVFSNSVLNCLIVFTALITDKINFQTLTGKGNLTVSHETSHNLFLTLPILTIFKPKEIIIRISLLKPL